jgi:opacity protein-like surface antigen
MKASVDYAGAFGLAGGWQLNPWLGAELETGAFYTHLDRLYDEFDSNSAHASLVNIPLTLNLVARYERPEHRWMGYVRGGAGVATGRFSMSGADEGEATARGTDWDMTFAYRVGAGVGYRLSKRWTVELGYELFGTGSSQWDVKEEDGSPVSMGFDSVLAHSVQCAFRFQF